MFFVSSTYILYIFDKECPFILCESLEVSLCVMPAIGRIKLLGVVPGIAPEEHIADAVTAEEWQQGLCEPLLLRQLLAAGLREGGYLVVLLRECCYHVQALPDVGSVSTGIIVEVIDVDAHDVNVSIPRIIIFHRLRSEVWAEGPYDLSGA